MPILTAEQIQALIETYASGITEIDVPGDKRIRYADPATLRKILADAMTEAPEGGSFRTLATFVRDR